MKKSLNFSLFYLIGFLLFSSCSKEDCSLCEQEDLLGQWVLDKNPKFKNDIVDVVYTFKENDVVYLFQEGGLFNGSIAFEAIPFQGSLYSFDPEILEIVFIPETIAAGIFIPEEAKAIYWEIKEIDLPSIVVDIKNFQDSLLATNVTLTKN